MDLQINGIKEIAREIYHELGPGRSEACYQKAFEICLSQSNVTYVSQYPVLIKFKGVPVGIEKADIVLEKIVIELKAIKRYKVEDIQQLERYMKDLELTNGVLVNFGEILEFKWVEGGDLMMF